MDDDLAIGSVVIPARELVERFSRSSGPGGQGVNTTDSRVQLRFDLVSSPSIPEYLRARAVRRLGSRLVAGVVVINASEQRSQLQNREAARARLQSMLTAAFAPGPSARRPTRPGKGAVDRRIKAKKGRGAVKRLRGSITRDE